MMLMKQIIEINLQPNSLLHYGKPYSIKLLFTKLPTQKQLELATMHYLTEHEYGDEIGLMFMTLVRETDVPEVHDYEESEHGEIFAEREYLFEMVEEDADSD